MPPEIEFNDHVVATRMGDFGYEAVCGVCGWRAKTSENWVLVASAIVAHFNATIRPS